MRRGWAGVAKELLAKIALYFNELEVSRKTAMEKFAILPGNGGNGGNA